MLARCPRTIPVQVATEDSPRSGAIRAGFGPGVGVGAGSGHGSSSQPPPSSSASGRFGAGGSSQPPGVATAEMATCPPDVEANIKRASFAEKPSASLYAVIEDCNGKPYFRDAVFKSLLAMVERGKSDSASH